ncbi:monocarboxylate transporter [Elysia marginata]|uniref:Monocarboxylate transporter n=1 Tax=Elysia marginata TaxID=1093978 RepID=A0AAV4GXM5_9GAST|nr:monocarboxylate transporter [Elysia marginata]
MGLDKLTNGFGLLCMVRGIGTIAGPPLAGAMYDSTGSYDLPFMLGGMLMFAGGYIYRVFGKYTRVSHVATSTVSSVSTQGCNMLLHLPCHRKKPAPLEQEFEVENIEELTDAELNQKAGQMAGQLAGQMGSRPKIITLEDAMSAV